MLSCIPPSEGGNASESRAALSEARGMCGSWSKRQEVYSLHKHIPLLPSALLAGRLHNALVEADGIFPLLRRGNPSDMLVSRNEALLLMSYAVYVQH